MDFEEQLEKAEKLSSPSLVGSSIRSADDSQHNNYIHPEKTGSKKKGFKKKSIINSTLGASLDDLISEGALLGSEEDFEKFLDNSGQVKEEVKAHDEEETKKSVNSSPESSLQQDKPKVEKTRTSPLRNEVQATNQETDQLENLEEPEETKEPNGKTLTNNLPEIAASGFTSSEATGDNSSALYSTPNLSEYQLENQIKDHTELLSSVKSIDPHRLPTRKDYPDQKEVENVNRASSAPIVLTTESEEDKIAAKLNVKDGIHTPYFQRDGRSSSRSRVPARTDRSRSRSSSARSHLARGDSYKNTVIDNPARYDRPPDFSVEEEEEEDGRRTRHSRPTMSAKVAAAEAANRSDVSLVTTGDYTNFNVDRDEPKLTSDMYTSRSESSYNYLRSISRSRSRQPSDRNATRERSNLSYEKNANDTTALKDEGALISDDPYSSINGLDTMMEEVLHVDSEKKNSNEKPVDKVGDIGDSKEILENLETDKKEKVNEKNENEIQTTGIEKEKESVEPETENSNVTSSDAINEKSELLESSSNIANSSKDNESAQNIVPSEDDILSTDNKKELNDKMSGISQELESNQEIKEENDICDDDNDVKKDDGKDKNEDMAALGNCSSELGDELKVKQSAEDLQDFESKEESDKPETDENKLEIADDQEQEIEAKERSTEGNEVEPEVKEGEVEKEEVTTSEPEASHENESNDRELSENKEEEVSSEQIGAMAAVSAAVSATATAATTMLKAATDADEEEPSESEETSKLEETMKLEESEPKESVNVEEPKLEESESDETSKLEEPKLDEPQEPESGETSKLEEPKLEKSESVETSKLEEPKLDEPQEPESGETSKLEEPKLEEPQDIKSKEIEVKKEEEGEEFDISPEELRKHLESQPVYIFTSLIGGMQIVHRTNKLAMILKANEIPYTTRDLGTDEEAKKIWRRYSQGKTLPGVVRGDDFIGNWQEIEDANEEYRIRELIYETL